MESIPYIPSVFALYADGLASAEWDARKAAADGFVRIGSTLRDGISPYKRDILDKLDQHKFDKVIFWREKTDSKNRLNLFEMQ